MASNGYNYTPPNLDPTNVTNRREAENLILDILKQYYPNLECGPGTPVYETTVRSNAFINGKTAEGMIEFIKSINLENPESMAVEDLDRAMTRFFEKRKRGRATEGVIRCVFNTPQTYDIKEGTVFAAAGNRLYEVINSLVVTDPKLIGGETVWLADIPVKSLGIGNAYNAKQGELIKPPVDLAVYTAKSYFMTDTTDGGVEETNQMFVDRIRNNLTLKNTTTVRGMRAFLYNNFNPSDVVVIKLGDPELRRDIFSLPSPTGIYEVSRGSMADIYVRNDPYVIVSDYQQPLGFPYKYAGLSIVDNPEALMNAWNALSFTDIDVHTRGSIREKLPLKGANQLFSLTSTIRPIQEVIDETDYKAIHSDNLIKQKWPIVVKVHVTISDSRGDAAVEAGKQAISLYISALRTGQYPQIDEVYKCLKNTAAISFVHTPITMEAYYIKDNLVMEMIGTGLRRYPEESLLKPTESDSLAFEMTSLCPISVRTCMFYTNKDLIDITVT